MASYSPTVWVAVEITVTALTIGLTSSSSKLLRLLGLLIVTTTAYLAFLTTFRHVSITMWASVLAGNASTYVLRYLDLALLDRWNFDDGGPTGKKEDSNKSTEVDTIERKRNKEPSSRDPTTWQRLWFGFNVTLNPRQLNTPYQVKNVPAWSSTDLEHVPSRENFLWRTAINISFNYIIVDLCSLGAQPERNAIMFSRDSIGFFSRLEYLGIEEVTIRALASLVLWLNVYCIFRVIHGLLSFLAVGSGISEVQDWAPPFGPLSEAYSIRRFWGYVETEMPSSLPSSLASSARIDLSRVAWLTKVQYLLAPNVPSDFRWPCSFPHPQRPPAVSRHIGCTLLQDFGDILHLRSLTPVYGYCDWYNMGRVWGYPVLLHASLRHPS